MRKKKILIFDEDKILLYLLFVVLKDKGYEVEISETSHDIIDRVTNFTPDLILLNNYTPSIGGSAATQLLKCHKIFNTIPIIFITATSNILSTGADNYLRKPINLDEFGRLVAKYLN
jgi:two-component system cell cycle response regulator DivK